MALSVKGKGKMIKILTLFRVVPDYDQVLKEDWKDVSHLDISFVSKIFDSFDEGAIEGALRLKDELVKAGIEVTCTAAGSGYNKDVLLSSLYAAGYDQVIFYENEKLREEVFLEKAGAEIKSENYDVIFAGNMSGPFGYRMDGPVLSTALGYPWYSDVTEVHYDEGHLAITVEKDHSFVTFRQEGPCVCSFGNAVNPVMRLFSLKARMEAGKKEIIRKKLSRFSISRDDVRIEVKTREKNCKMLDKNNEDTIAFIKKACKERRYDS